MLTPAQRHFQRVMAERHGKTEEFTEAARTAHEQILHRLRMDQSALKRVQSDQAKAEMKKQLLPHYEGWIEGTLDGNSGRQDEVIVTLMIWAIDAGDYPLAVRIGRYVIEHNLAMPDQFRRTAATALVEELCDPILVQVKADESTDLTAHLQVLDELAQIVDGKDMPDVVLAKLFKARGFALRGGDDAAQAKALELLRQALKLDANAGVKKAIESLARQVKKAGQSTDGAGDNDADTSGTATTDAAAASKTTVPATPRRQRSSTARKPSAAKKTAGKAAGKKAKQDATE
ncbi:phage terminase small subunit [Serratia marcescens]|uniref:phage terminase small subunit n=1 Tax=Serratia marcescens TaxID=615 RepID=UPI000E3C4A59|nr:phage terminase small subunit [Serratia marcescens]MDU1286522.1 phage terminase small subunit [Serratia marcescens]MDU1395212.1 phage terminase small subunit [Serratia marcescens]RFT82955.1 terminase [Serratia marcescens]TFZ86699.1 terminase [Serratia marcescens]